MALLSSYVAGTLLWVAVSIAEAQADKLCITSTNMAESPSLAIVLTHQLIQTLYQCYWLDTLASCGAWMLLRAAAPFAVSLACTRSISATTTLASPFCKLFIHLSLLIIITCDHMDVWDDAALLIYIIWVQGQHDTRDDGSYTNPAALLTRISQATHQIRHKSESICVMD